MLKRTRYFLVALITLLMSATFFGVQATDTLYFRLSEDPETLYNVNTTSLTANDTIGSYLTESLIYFGADGKPKPWLAESWEVSSDQTEVTFKLRKGVKFHDGTDFNAAAVKFHFDSILDKTAASPILPLMGSLQSVETIDDHTVKLKFEKPNAPFFIRIAGAAGGINSPTAVKKFGKEYGRNPVGTGPYMFKSWNPGTEIVYVRNPNYQQFRKDVINKGQPYAKTIILTVIPEEAVAQAALETGELMATGLQADTIQRFYDDQENFNIILDKEATNLVFLEYNYKIPPFNDPKFRHALGYAVDRKAAIQAAWSGFAEPAYSPLAVGIPGYDAQLVGKLGTKYNPEKAKELLAQLGWKDTDGDGILDKDGKPAKFLIKSYAGFTHIERTLVVIQSNFKDIGIEVDLETADWGAFYPSLLKDDWHMDLMRWTSSDPGVLTQLFKSPGHRKKLPSTPKIDDVLAQCDILMDPEKRHKCVSQAQQALMEEAIVLPILTNWLMIATPKKVKDYHLDFLNFLIPGDVQVVE